MNTEAGRKSSDEMDDLKQCLNDHMMSAVGAMLDLQFAVRRATEGGSTERDTTALESAEREAETTMRDYEIIRRRVCGLVKEGVSHCAGLR